MERREINISEFFGIPINSADQEQEEMEGSSSSIEENRWRDLPLPLLEKIFERVHLQQRISAVPFVCKSWYEASRSPLCWKSLNFKEITNYSYWDNDHDCSSLLMKTAELGEASVVFLGYKIYDSLDALAYFAERCPNLILLRLSASWRLHESVGVVECLKNILAKWKDLEFVRFDYLPLPLVDILPILGENCNKLGFLIITGKIRDDDAAAIVNFLSRITRLKLFESKMSRESLLLILQGCKQLQELSLAGYVDFDWIDEEIRAAASHLKKFDAANIRSLHEDEDYSIDGEDFSCTDISEMY